jgi:hypothetical protein
MMDSATGYYCSYYLASSKGISRVHFPPHQVIRFSLVEAYGHASCCGVEWSSLTNNYTDE